ncbi:MAG: lysozyme [Magnetococcales bacterium]|nr:lysozyme [Magnetococcales bacterium]
MAGFDAEQHGDRLADLINLQRLKEQLILHEGLRLKPYHCSANKLTIGVGRNLDDVGITEEEALFLLGNDIARVIPELDRNIPAFTDLDETRKRVLIDMGFNLGISRLLQFRRMLAALEQGDYQNASIEMMDSRWARQVGSRAERLKHMMKTGAE